MKRRLFGTDGIRGEAGAFPLDQDTVKKVGAALALSMQNGGHQLKVAIGRDTRESGTWISKVLLEASGLMRRGSGLGSRDYYDAWAGFSDSSA